MILNYLKGKIKRFWDIIEEPSVYLTILIILVAFISFGLGRLSLGKVNKEEIKITMPDGEVGTIPKTSSQKASVGAVSIQNNNNVVASKNGTKYYYSWCSGVSRINEENKVFFSSPNEAEQAGYTIAANCTAP